MLLVSEFRKHFKTRLEDEAIQRLLDANSDEIIARVGPVGETSEIRFPRPFESIILLGRAAFSITSIKEAFGYDDELTLDPADYIVHRTTLRRVESGPNPRGSWVAPVQIIWTPGEDTNSRVRVLIELTKLDINSNPGMRAFTVGQHREEYDSGSATSKSPEQRREELLLSLQGLVPLMS